MQTARLGLPRALAAIAPGALLALAAGCLDTETDLLDDDPGPPADVDGVWSYSVKVVSTAATCAAAGVTLTFFQDSVDFSGTASGGQLVCEVLGETLTDSIGVRPLLDGLVAGDILRFAIGDDNWIHVGQVSQDGSSITGDAQIIRDFPNISRQTMQGPFEAHRQPAP